LNQFSSSVLNRTELLGLRLDWVAVGDLRGALNFIWNRNFDFDGRSSYRALLFTFIDWVLCFDELLFWSKIPIAVRFLNLFSLTDSNTTKAVKAKTDG